MQYPLLICFFVTECMHLSCLFLQDLRTSQLCHYQFFHKSKACCFSKISSLPDLTIPILRTTVNWELRTSQLCHCQFFHKGNACCFSKMSSLPRPDNTKIWSCLHWMNHALQALYHLPTNFHYWDKKGAHFSCCPQNHFPLLIWYLTRPAFPWYPANHGGCPTVAHCAICCLDTEIKSSYRLYFDYNTRPHQILLPSATTLKVTICFKLFTHLIFDLTWPVFTWYPVNSGVESTL